MYKFITWNINFYQNYRKKSWKDNIAKYLSMLDYDFVLLQESNPSIIFNNDDCQFEINDKNVYFNKLLNEEIGANTEKIIPWGNAIIADKEYTFLRNNFINEKGETENYYFGKSAFMCYDFRLSDEDTITFLNFYNKNKNGQYPMLKTVITDVEKILKQSNKRIVVFCGDFNSDRERDPNNREFFNQLSQLGLVNCTDDIEFATTMVPEIGLKRQYPNDKIFINKPWDKYVICKLLKNTTIDLSDHRPIECTIHAFFLGSDKNEKNFLEWLDEGEE